MPSPRIAVEREVPARINLTMYVDDGRTFDTCADVCDAFLERLAQRFSITRDGGSPRRTATA